MLEKMYSSFKWIELKIESYKVYENEIYISKSKIKGYL